MHSFLEHTVRVTDIIIGNGGCNAIIISAAEDCTCKVWFAFLLQCFYFNIMLVK